MTQEEKQLLVKALCGYWPYGVICNRPSGDSVITKIYFDKEYNDWVAYNEEGLGGSITFEKPYLRPMSSMTEDERYEYEGTRCQTFLENGESERSDTIDTYDWLNANCFDYRGLIEKGLALKAPEGMYETKAE